MGVHIHREKRNSQEGNAVGKRVGDGENIEHKKNEYREEIYAGCSGLGNVVVLRRKWHRGCAGLGNIVAAVEERREATKSGGLVQGRKDAAC
jgi:hypothetical protein